MGDTLLKVLVAEYLIIAAVYVFQTPPELGKVFYFVGATILSCGVLMMK